MTGRKGLYFLPMHTNLSNMKTAEDRQREVIRTKATMHFLRDGVGVDSIYEFAGIYDALDGGTSNTQESKKWHPLFSGKQPLTIKALNSLSTYFPDAERMHRNGPGFLWKAMWGTLGEVRSVVADDFKAWRSFDVALAEFEAEILISEVYRQPLTVQQLAKAVALHRLHQELLGFDGVGTFRCVRSCLTDRSVQIALQLLAVFNDVCAQLATIASDPLATTQAAQRWTDLESKLDWIG